jgi:uncharacterized cupin superfamily protein
MKISKLATVPKIDSSSLENWGDVPVPIDSAPSVLSGQKLCSNADGSTAGVWESTPGKWRRQVKNAEMCYFLEGECTYTDEEGQVTTITAGDLIYFPANSLGIWDIKSKSRKVYITYESRLD